MKPIIGIISRNFKSSENHNISIIYKDIEKAIIKNNGIPIGITLCKNYKELIDICDGIIFQGGDDFEENDFDSLEYCYDINKPVLGICLGMQLMGILFHGELIDINNHKKKLDYAHSIKIKRNSTLYNIFKSDVIKVNSRHKSVIKNTSLNVVGINNDGYVEAVESTSKKFFLGVQWHPESMLSYDNKQNNLFRYFVNVCKRI